MQAQKVPLLPPPFLQEDYATEKKRRKKKGEAHRDMSGPIQLRAASLRWQGGGGYRGKCQSLTECTSGMLSEKGHLVDFEDEYLSEVLIKIQKVRFNRRRLKAILNPEE